MKLSEVVDRQALIIEELAGLCGELINILAQYTEIEDYEMALNDIRGEI